MKKILLTILICLFSMSAMSQTSNQKLNEDLQTAIKIRKINESESARNGKPTNFLIGMCQNITGISQCNLDVATRNINNKSSDQEFWLFFLESSVVGEIYFRGLNGQISNPDGFISKSVRYKVIDGNNVERNTIHSSNCVETSVIRKIDQNTVITKHTGLDDGCSETLKRANSPDLNIWSKPLKIYPIENRFSLSPSNQPKPQTQSAVMSDRLINDLLKFRWVNNAGQCDAMNTNYSVFNRKNGRYFVMGGKRLDNQNNSNVVEISEVSANQVNMFIGIGERAMSDGLFNMIIKLQITKQSDGSMLVSERTASWLDKRGGALVTRDATFSDPPTDRKYFPCLNDGLDGSSSPQQPSSTTQTLNYSHGKYVGEVMNGKAHGYGTYTSANSGTIYTGQFIADTFSGDGTMTWTNGSKFVGKWQNDVGVRGTMTYANGSTTSGTVRTGVFTPSASQSSAQQSTIVWNHNNSKMKIDMVNNTINIYYTQPRQAMLDAGAKPNDLLVNGTIQNNQITGTARIFAGRCGQFTYPVTGNISNNGREISLNGQAPVVNLSNCQVTRYVPDPLSFNVIQTNTQSNSQQSQPQANTDVEIKYANGDFYLGKVRNGVQDGYGGYWFSSRSELISTTWSNGKMVNGSDAFLKYTSAEKRSLPQISGKIIDGRFVSLSTLDLRKKIVSLNDEILKLEKQRPSNTGTSWSFDLKKFNFDGLYDDIKLNDILARLEGFREISQKELGSSVQTSRLNTQQQELTLNLKTMITKTRREIETLQKDALILDIKNVSNDPTKGVDINKINDVTKLTEILSEMSKTRDSLKSSLDTAFSLAPTLKIQ